MTASTLEILGTRPLLGRAFDAADEVPGAPAVVLLGYHVWQSRLGADPAVVGRRVRLGRDLYTVIGVMPEDFLFPVREQLWVPMRGGEDDARAVRIIGRLADGVSTEAAQTELTAAAVRMATTAADPERAKLRAEVVPFALAFVSLPNGGLEHLPGFHLFRILALVLLLVACGNVAMLVFARTATRFRELSVRTALGASRARIVSQIFLETLVLAVLAAGIGLVSIHVLLEWLRERVLASGVTIPYWFDPGLSPAAVFQALVLAVLSATVAGVLPALKITGAKIHESIRRADSDRSGIRFGGITSTLIVADVAIAVTVLGLVIGIAGRVRDVAQTADLVGIPAEEFLAAELRWPADERGDDAASDGRRMRLASTQLRVVELLQAEPRVRSVAAASVLPRMDHPSRLIEIEGTVTSEQPVRTYVRTARLDVDYLAVLGRPILAGRGFLPGDARAPESPVIVNTVFVDRFLGGRDPIGRRLRFVASEDGAGTGREIVGVIGHLGANIVNPAGDAALYVPAAAGTIHPLRLAIHLEGPPETFAPRLRDIVAAVDGDAILATPVVLTDAVQGDWYLTIAVAGGLALLVGVLTGLAACGLYTMLSLSVSERTREIGIRCALGARRPTLLLTLLRRTIVQIALGALIGLPFAARFVFELRKNVDGSASAGAALVSALALAVGIIAVFGLLSCLVPARRVLRIHPGEALRT